MTIVRGKIDHYRKLKYSHPLSVTVSGNVCSKLVVSAVDSVLGWGMSGCDDMEGTGGLRRPGRLAATGEKEVWKRK